jgi:hypothetical protein
LFEFGDAKAVGVVNAIGLEDGGESVEDGGLPVGDEVRLDAVLAAEFGLAGFAAEQLQDNSRFELSRKGSTGTRHDSGSWSGPVRYRLLVQRQGRSSHFIDAVYNVKRIHSSLGYLTPQEFEEQWRVKRGRRTTAKT